MTKRLLVNMGFITNSSSCVYSFPREVLEDPDVKLFLERYELAGGYVGEDLWYRSQCGSFIVTDKQYKEAQKALSAEEFSSAKLPAKEDNVILIYGDEYDDITQMLCSLLRNVSELLGLGSGYVSDYN